ncbi:hypothetical protein [Iodobacter ciconiae]|uniref:Uncharacterized protein n=1 Tax=Iodobacter ciconiae TaxID=2496266 RepID=A0A3S8ZS05_9NEIS|nr:hypothetical protein [Iodobacter ciconiae]AZN36191.1 hypothetical protein EJO50_06675 [Iodobacter ciconiae]
MKIAAEFMQPIIQSLSTRSRTSEKGEDTSTQSSSASFKLPQWDPVDSRKSAARARLDMLKRQLDGLLKFAGVGKGNVAAAARLAKQIAAAVAEYAGISGGSAVQAPVVAGSAPATQASPSVGKSESATAEQVQAAAESAEKVENAEKVEKPPADLPSMAQSKNGMSAQDGGFMEEAKRVMQKAKLLLALEIQKSKRDSKEDKALHDDAIKTMDDTFKKASIALDQAGKDTNSPVVYAADGGTTTIQVSMPQFSAQA